jgi:glycine oxidase
MAAAADVLILGGGVIGLTTAYYLARGGARVTVLDGGDFGGQASWAGAGIIPPGHSAGARSPCGLLRARSAELYPELSEQLREETGIDNGYLVSGGMEIAHDDEGPSEEWQAEGIDCRPLDAEGLRRLEPVLGPAVRRGYHLPGMAQVRNPRHLRALVAACRRRGVVLQSHCPARTLLRERDRVTAVETDAGRLSAECYLVAAGAWADGLLGELGCRPGIHPVRGQIALLDAGRPGRRPILLRGKRYLVPRPDGRLLVGSTEERAGYDARPTAGAIGELIEFARGLIPSLAGATLEACWAGLRPGTPDGMPYVGPVPGVRNAFVAAGHFRAGIQLSPGTGLAMSELLLGHSPSIPLDPFRLDRAPAPEGRPAFRP